MSIASSARVSTGMPISTKSGSRFNFMTGLSIPKGCDISHQHLIRAMLRTVLAAYDVKLTVFEHRLGGQHRSRQRRTGQISIPSAVVEQHLFEKDRIVARAPATPDQ